MMLDAWIASYIIKAGPLFAKAGNSYLNYTASREATQTLEEINRMAGSADGLRTGIVGELTTKGLTTNEIARATAFMRTDAGFEVIRLIFIATLAPSTEKEEYRLLIEYAKTLMALEDRAEHSYHVTAAEVLVRYTARVLTELETQLKSSKRATNNSEAYIDLRNEAREQRLEVALLGKGHLGQRGTRARDLAAKLPLDLAEQVGIYLEAVEADNSTFNVPTLDRQIKMSISTGYIYPNFARDSSSARRTTFAELLNLAERERRLVMLGDPGSGKSTATIAITHSVAQAAIKGETRYIPFLITLRHFAAARVNDPGLGFLRYLSLQLGSKYDMIEPLHTIRYLCHVGRALIIFDGLDEILSRDLRLETSQYITTLSDAFPSCIFMVTARVAGYEEAAPSGFPVQIETLPFSSTQVYGFVQNFLSASDPIIDNRNSQRFMDQTQNISDLRSSPLLLGVICALYACGRTLPKNRVELYTKCAEMLFDAWDERKALVVPFEYREAAESAVRELAYQVFTSSSEEISERSLETFLENYFQKNFDRTAIAARRFAVETLKLWRGRKWLMVFVGTRDGVDYFRFSHRTFLEFFAADELIYQTMDPASLWNKLRGYLENRSAVHFSLLCLELMSRKTAGGVDSFHSEATRHVRREVAAGNYVKAFNTAITSIESLACTQGDSGIRSALVREYLGLALDLLPWISFSEIDSEIPSIGYVEVLNEDPDSKHPWSPLPEPDEMENYSAGGRVTVQELLIPLKALADLRALEQAAMLNLLYSFTLELSSTNLAGALRLSMCFMQAGDLESWSRVDRQFCRDLFEVGRLSWDAAVELSDAQDLIRIDDVWIRVCLCVRSRLGWGSLGKTGTILPYFVGGWPYPTYNEARGVPLHATVLSILGADAPPGKHATRPQEKAEFVKWFDPSIEAQFLHPRVEDFGSLDEFGGSLPQISGDDVTDREAWVVSCLLIGLLRLGDEDFVDNVLHSIERDNIQKGIARIVDAARRPDEVDVDVAVSWLQNMSESERIRCERVLLM